MKKQILTGILAASLVLPFTSNIHKVEAAAPENVVNVAESELGVHYQFGGTSPSGFDCSGFVRYVFSKLNIDLPRTTGEQYRIGKTESKSELEPGDLVFFDNTYKAGISHVGIYIGHNEFISATTSKGVAIVSLSNEYWAPRFVAGKRVLNFDELPAGQYHDVAKDDVAYEAISSLGKAGIINGYEDSFFRPELTVTRGQAAALINRKLNLKASSTTAFTDVSKSNDFADDIAAIKEAGIIEGYSDGSFHPYEKLTRAQMAAIMDRAFRLSKTNNITTADVKYTDVSSQYWAYRSIIALKNADVTSNYNHSTFRATAPATRADFATALYSAIQVK